MNAMLIPTDFHFKLNYVILVLLNSQESISLYHYSILNLSCNGLKVNLLIHAALSVSYTGDEIS